MHTFWLRLRDPPGCTSAFDSRRPSTTYQHRTATDQETEEFSTATTAAA
ncbi:unnamed protein product [Acanthoscelides obtectus]|uniref:Uncharacterized protein n=1 Tax=Acanthoscelides obtectus TaxID=200917 RepID=A0A9P0KLZ8_ACAOB|nr:unnamed protein product [Acanthoscelides obtectus]CAK1642622.1 hypothetical protein AOBTE_LOCUS13141 [Acanthoscelides obtectus]